MRCFKSVVSLVLALFLTLPLLAQVKIRGRVLDGSTPVTGAMAGAKGGLSKVMSGDDGRFVLNVSPGATVEVCVIQTVNLVIKSDKAMVTSTTHLVIVINNNFFTAFIDIISRTIIFNRG